MLNLFFPIKHPSVYVHACSVEPRVDITYCWVYATVGKKAQTNCHALLGPFPQIFHAAAHLQPALPLPMSQTLDTSFSIPNSHLSGSLAKSPVATVERGGKRVPCPPTGETAVLLRLRWPSGPRR